MIEINKNYILDENHQAIALQIPVADFEQIEEILEDYGLAKLMDETKFEELLSKDEAIKYYQLVKGNNVEI